MSFSFHVYLLYHRHLGQGCLEMGLAILFIVIVVKPQYYLHHRHHGLQGHGRWKDKLPGGKNGDYKEKPGHTSAGSFSELYFVKNKSNVLTPFLNPNLESSLPGVRGEVLGEEGGARLVGDQAHQEAGR